MKKFLLWFTPGLIIGVLIILASWGPRARRWLLVERKEGGLGRPPPDWGVGRRVTGERSARWSLANSSPELVDCGRLFAGPVPGPAHAGETA